MKIDRKYKPELCASKDPMRIPLQYVAIDGNQAVATDGRRLVCVPCERSEGDGDGVLLVKPEHLIADRRNCNKKRPNVELVINGPVVRRVNRQGDTVEIKSKSDHHGFTNFPKNWKEVIPKADRKNVVINLNAKLLYEIAQAMGSDLVSIKAEASAEHEPIVINPINYQGAIINEAIGVLMPLRAQT
jgi:hypothetical protein